MFYAYHNIDLHAISSDRKLKNFNFDAVSIYLMSDLLNVLSGSEAYRPQLGFTHFAGPLTATYYGQFLSKAYAVDIFEALFE